jgi:hypothetical protein
MKEKEKKKAGARRPAERERLARPGKKKRR